MSDEKFTLEIGPENAEWWIDPNGVIHLALPNDVDGVFVQMHDGTRAAPNAYPRFVWEKLRWRRLPSQYIDPVAKALKELE